MQYQPPLLPRSRTSTSLLESTPENVQLRASRRASLPLLPESAPITRPSPEMSLHPPMRRRSLIQTPGVATRTRPSPLPEKPSKSTFRHSHPPMPSMLSSQPSLESIDGLFLSIPTLAAGHRPHVLTPREADYSTTGAFKLGTLRITNGCPDLTANAAETMKEVDEKHSILNPHSGYFTPVPSCMAQTAEPTSEMSPPVLSISAQHTEGYCPPGLQQSPDVIPHEFPASLALETQSKQAAMDDHLFDDDNQTEISTVEVLDIRVDSNARSPALQQAESMQAGTHGVKRTDSGFVSNTKSDSSQSHTSLAKADSGYSSNVSLRSLRGNMNPNAPDKEARSSNDSDSGSSKVHGRGSPSVLEIQPPPSPATAGDVPTADISSAPVKVLTPPPKDNGLSKTASQLPLEEVRDVDIQATREKSRRRLQPAHIDTCQSGNRALQSFESAPHTPASGKSEASSSSASIGNNVQRPGRLQRLLSLRSSSFSRQTLTVHATHTLDSMAPSVPKEVEEKFREHTGFSPISTKRLTVKNQTSKETLQTILSVGSLELSREDDLSPSTLDSFSKEEEKEKLDHADSKESSLKNTFHSMQSNLRNAAASVISNRKSVTRRPAPLRTRSQKANTNHQSGKDDSILSMEAEITSYRSINDSLGSNPYDVAARAMQPRTRPDMSLSSVANRERRTDLRTYSLDSMHSTVLDSIPSPTYTESGNTSPGQKQKTFPPVSMTTRGSFRTPPRRSSLSPQGPAVPRGNSRERNPGFAAPGVDQLHAQRMSLDGGSQRGRPVSGFQYRAASCGPSTRHNSFGSQTSSPVHSRHNSLSSVQSDSVRGSPEFHSPGRNYNGPDLKHHPNIDRFTRNHFHGVYVPQPAHQGPRSRTIPQNNLHLTGGRQYTNQQVWQPPYVPRGAHRQSSSGGQPPYRILHSYNSPAYRNAPIWG